MQDFIHVRVESAAFEPDSVHVAALSGRETLSRLFEFELRLVTADGGLDEEALLSSPVTLVFERRASGAGGVTEVRRIPGMVHAVLDRALGESRHREYVASFVPRVWQASLSSTSDVCMDMTVPQILQKKLKEGAALEGADVELRLSAKYPVREFVVQYKETNLDFVSRLAEDLGIFFFFEEANGKDVIVFGDDNSAVKASFPDKSAFSARGDRVHVFELEARRQLVSKDFVARDYNYRNPAMEVLGEAAVGVLATGKVDEYGPHAKTPEEATFYAKVRAQEATSTSLVYNGQSDLPGLRAGSVLAVEGHPRGELELLVTEVVHEMSQPVFGQPVAQERPYQNRFHAIPKATAYRPPRLTRKPVVNSVLTGIVESESPTNYGAVDDQGRYRVAFMYDAVTGRGDGKASRPLRMAQPSAASDRGFHIPLKPGTEVIISCVNGDPDRPIIAGAVPNPQTPSPVTSAISNKSIWTTNQNSIAIDDHEARCKISVSVENHIIQMGAPEAPEDGVLIGTVKNSSEIANEDKTESNKKKSVYTDELTVLAAKDILLAAGIPNPMSLWNKVEEAADKVEKYVKQIADIGDKVLKQYDKHFGHAKKDMDEAQKALKDDIAKAKVLPAKRAKEADEKLHETTEKLKKDMHVKEKAKPKPGETQAQAEQRTFSEELAKDPWSKTELDSASENAQAAHEAKSKVEQDRKPRPIVDPTTGNTREETAEEADQRSFKNQLAHDHEANESVKASSEEAVEAQKNYEEFTAPPKEAKKLAHELNEKVHQIGELGEQAMELKEKLEKLKKVEETIAKIPGAKKLISLISKVFSKAAEEAFDATVASSQKLSRAVPKASKERSAADVGSFGKPFNIQLSRNSAALYGVKDAFVFGGENATMFSAMSTSILGTSRVDVKSRTLVEVAARDVMLTGSKNIDAHATEKLKLVAHKGDKAIEIPGGFNMYFHAKEGLLMDTVEKDIEARAKKNFKVKTLEENVEFSAKQTFKVDAEDKNVEITAKKGKIEIMANDGQTSVRAKQKALVQSLEGDFTVVSDKGKGTVKSSTELNLECKTGQWKAKEVEIAARSKFTVKSGKIELG